MRIPFATVLFIGSVFILLSPDLFKPFVQPNSLLGMAGALLCICMLVYSIVLYSNLDMPANKH